MTEWIDRAVLLAIVLILLVGLAACATTDPGRSSRVPSGPDAAVASIAAPVTEDEVGDVAGCWELANPRSLGEPLERIEIRPVDGIMRMDTEGRPELRWALEHTA